MLIIAVISVSSAAILVRLSGVHGFAAATWRLVLGTFITLFIAITACRKFPSLPRSRRSLVLLLVSGVSLALHFDLWMLSLNYIYVSLSVMIVDSYPAILVPLGRLVLGERYHPVQVLGAFIAMIGVFLLSATSSGGEMYSIGGGSTATGIGLAFGGMIALAAYLAIGKVLRREMSTWSYTFYVYGLAGAASFVFSVILGVRLWGYTLTQYFYLVLLAIIPMIGGHTVLNYLLRKMSLLGVAVPVLGEPIGASLLAWVLFSEVLSVEAVGLMTLVLLGITLAVMGEALQGKTA